MYWLRFVGRRDMGSGLSVCVLILPLPYHHYEYPLPSPTNLIDIDHRFTVMKLIRHLCFLQATHEGPSGPEEFAQELQKFNFADESATENHHGTIDKLRVSLSTNGLG